MNKLNKFSYLFQLVFHEGRFWLYDGQVQLDWFGGSSFILPSGRKHYNQWHWRHHAVICAYWILNFVSSFSQQLNCFSRTSWYGQRKICMGYYMPDILCRSTALWKWYVNTIEASLDFVVWKSANVSNRWAESGPCLKYY